MKKLFTLIAGAFAALSVNAQTVVYSWESPEGTPIEKGGTIAYVNGDGNRLNYTNGAKDDNGSIVIVGADGVETKYSQYYWTICLNGKKGNLADAEPSANAGHMVITLDKALEGNETIEMTAYYNKGEVKDVSAYILFKDGVAVSSTTGFPDILTGATPATESIAVPADAAGCTTITMTRDKASTNLFITKLVITRPGGEVVDPGTEDQPGEGGAAFDAASAEVIDVMSEGVQAAIATALENPIPVNDTNIFLVEESAKIYPVDTFVNGGDAVVPADGQPLTLNAYRWTATTENLTVTAQSTPNHDASVAEGWQKNGNGTTQSLTDETCDLKFTNYYKPKNGSPTLGYKSYYEEGSSGGTVFRVTDGPEWTSGCGKLPIKGNLYEITAKQDGVVKMGIWINKNLNKNKFMIIDCSTEAAGYTLVPNTDIQMQGFRNDNTYEKNAEGEKIGGTVAYTLDENYLLQNELMGTDTNRAFFGYATWNVKAGVKYIAMSNSTLGFFGIGYCAAGTDGIENVQVVAPANNIMYNLSGQVVDKSYRGVVIMNGKKYMNK